jgi:hypothetical protein
VDSYRLQIPYVPREGRRTLLLLVAGALVVGGLAVAAATAALLPLSLAVAGCALYAVLYVKHPTYQYIDALTIDAQGIWFLRELRPRGSASQFAWREIKAVSARLASQGEESQGLEITTTRFGPKGTPVLVPIGSEAECLAALRVAHAFAKQGAESAA